MNFISTDFSHALRRFYTFPCFFFFFKQKTAYEMVYSDWSSDVCSSDLDYLSAQSNSMAFCLSVEQLLGVEVPERVRWIRVLIAELQRINSHLVWLGTHGMEVGAVSVMLYCFRERELLLNINEMIAGFRLFPSYIRICGLREDLPRGFHDAVRAFLDRFPAKLDDYEDLLTKNEIYLKRAQGVGRISADDALSYGLVGPIARASGLNYDVRKVFPYLGYDTF